MILSLKEYPAMINPDSSTQRARDLKEGGRVLLKYYILTQSGQNFEQ